MCEELSRLRTALTALEAEESGRREQYEKLRANLIAQIDMARDEHYRLAYGVGLDDELLIIDACRSILAGMFALRNFQSETAYFYGTYESEGNTFARIANRKSTALSHVVVGGIPIIVLQEMRKAWLEREKP
jgi:hypothetical protein